MGLSNDDRGWVMTGMSGIACVFGASLICIDLVVRLFPGKRDWDIKNSDTFLSVSLSLSFGVMLFSALYSMLPSSKTSLMHGGLSSKEASWVMIACFLGGVVGIQIVSRLLHRYVPHHTVDCEHTHNDEEAQKESHDSDHAHAHTHPTRPNQLGRRTKSALPGQPQRSDILRTQPNPHQADVHSLTPETSQNGHPTSRPTLQSQITGKLSKLTSGKDPACDCDGPCYGFSDPCHPACFKNVSTKAGSKAPNPTTGLHRPPAVASATATEATPLLCDLSTEPLTRPHTRAVVEGSDVHLDAGPSEESSATCVQENEHETLHKTHSHQSYGDDNSNHSHHDEHAEPHHHHVPTNAFLSIGLQTSIAIALHKLPEGFITYATNHANPKLGLSVFLALFIHNITEGFAMALPLYLAINNRVKAMLVSFVLGGLSQPIGAGVAALWFKLAGRSGWQPNETGYGAMFAITAGILASVALQLFSESLDLTHSKHLCMIGAFSGMAILGISSALTA